MSIYDKFNEHNPIKSKDIKLVWDLVGKPLNREAIKLAIKGIESGKYHQIRHKLYGSGNSCCIMGLAMIVTNKAAVFQCDLELPRFKHDNYTINSIIDLNDEFYMSFDEFRKLFNRMLRNDPSRGRK